MWQEPNGGFNEEVSAIETHLKEMVDSGKMANSLEAVKNRMKELTKVTNMQKEDRNIIKIGVISNYVKFLKENDNIFGNAKKYGRT